MARYTCFVVLAVFVKWTSALQCYDCQNVTDVHACSQMLTCAANEVCYMGSTALANTEWAYTLTCKDNIHCNPIGSTGAAIGRSIGSIGSSTSKRDVACHECCSTSLCNKALCNHPRPATCTDDQSVDCAKIHSIFNVCADIQKAKLVCPRFCNLCNIVDGNWNRWSSWGTCDVTCANGTQTRQRTCTDPAPQNGGLDCVGVGIESQTCSLDSCPIHGGWSLWSPWGSCSVTCDVGMQRRDRSCSNPYPAKGGYHCYGDSRDDQICYNPGCTNGVWSAWTGWSTCTATCGGGLRTRGRLCNNPAPSLLGHDCDGSPQDIDLCNNVPCTGPDIQFIVGTPTLTECSTAWTLTTCDIAFGKFISLPNAQFNLHTATFVASKPGTYWFEWNLAERTDFMNCNVYKNDNAIEYIRVNPNHTQVHIEVQLMTNDNFRLHSCSWLGTSQTLNSGSTFTGFLMH